jgi:hypothetical protein
MRTWKFQGCYEVRSEAKIVIDRGRAVRYVRNRTKQAFSET